MDTYETKLRKYEEKVKSVWDPLLKRGDKLDEIDDDEKYVEELKLLQKDVMEASQKFAEEQTVFWSGEDGANIYKLYKDIFSFITSLTSYEWVADDVDDENKSGAAAVSTFAIAAFAGATALMF